MSVLSFFSIALGSKVRHAKVEETEVGDNFKI
jgi:hypothetical protein